jgi:uncharacterized protein DUF5317
MFILYAVAIGLLAGILTGGRLERLSTLQLRWVPLALIGFAVQLVLFWGPVNRAVGEAGPPIYVASTVAVLVFVLRNLARAGFALVAVGSLSNLAAIVANGGYMPTTAEAVVTPLRWARGSGRLRGRRSCFRRRPSRPPARSLRPSTGSAEPAWCRSSPQEA